MTSFSRLNEGRPRPVTSEFSQLPFKDKSLPTQRLIHSSHYQKQQQHHSQQKDVESKTNREEILINNALTKNGSLSLSLCPPIWVLAGELLKPPIDLQTGQKSIAATSVVSFFFRVHQRDNAARRIFLQLWQPTCLAISSDGRRRSHRSVSSEFFPRRKVAHDVTSN